MENARFLSNLYTKIVSSATSSGPAIANESADRLPRVTGDNYVVFNSVMVNRQVVTIHSGIKCLCPEMSQSAQD